MSDLIPDEERGSLYSDPLRRAVAEELIDAGWDAGPHLSSEEAYALAGAVMNKFLVRVSPVTREALALAAEAKAFHGQMVAYTNQEARLASFVYHLVNAIEALAVSPPAEATDEMVEKAAGVLLHDYQMQYDGGELSEFLDLARAALTAALGVPVSPEEPKITDPVIAELLTRKHTDTPESEGNK